MVAAATLGAGVLSAGASIFGSSRAADAQTAAANAAIANSRYMFNQSRNALQPYMSGGSNAIDSLSNWNDPTSNTNVLSQLIRLVTPGADMSAALAQTPGYQFSQSQGQRAVQNALAGRGLGGSAGAVARGVADYTQGLAGTTWNQVVQNLLSTFGAESNSLQGLVSTGANAANSLAGASSNTSNQINSALIGAGNAQAASSNALGSAMGGLGNNLTMAALLRSLQSNSGSGGGSIYSGYNTTGLPGA